MAVPRDRKNGTCSFCKRVVSKAGMTKHLACCEERKKLAHAGAKKSSVDATLLHLVVEGEWYYWMQIEAPGAAKLEELDQFLRDTWLECCHHMSAFTIEGTRYSRAPMTDYDEKGMNAPLHSVLVPGKNFYHEYDFGSTTVLRLRLLGKRKGKVGRPRVSVLARNLPLVIPCSECGKSSTRVCTQCVHSSGKGWYCDSCAEAHECGEDVLLPVVDSPRVGVCGYTG